MAPIVIADIKRQLSKTAPSKKAPLVSRRPAWRDMFAEATGRNAQYASRFFVE
jgi:hypothetical protein